MIKKFGFRDDKQKWGKRISSPNGWIEILKQNMKPGQINPHISLIALKDGMASYLSDIWGEVRSQLTSRDKESSTVGNNNGLYLNNTFAMAEVYSKNYIPAHACNAAISTTEKVYGTLDPQDVRRGLGTTGEVTDLKAFVNLGTKYKDEIEAVRTRQDSLANTPIMINDEDMMLIYENATFASSEQRYNVNYAMIRPEVVARLKYRFKNNNTSVIKEAMEQIINYETLIKRIDNVFVDTKAVIAKYNTAKKVVGFTTEVTDAMDEGGYTSVESDSNAVSKEDYYYINNPAVLYQLIDYRQQNEESHVRIDFVPLSTFDNLKGKSAAHYLTEAYEPAKLSIDKEEVKEEDGALTKEQKDIVNRLIDEKIDDSNRNYVNIIAPNAEFNEDDLIYLDERGHSTRALDIISKSRSDGDYDDETGDASNVSMDLSEETTSHVYHVTSLDPRFFSSSGYKNSGYYSTNDISVNDTLLQLKAYISSIFSASNSSSAILSFTSKLIDITNSRNGYTLDIQAADFYGLKGHMEDAIRVDTMRIANNKNHFVLTAGPKIAKKKRIIGTPDMIVTNNSIEKFNKSKVVTIRSFSTIKPQQEFVEATRLMNGIAYVSMNPSNEMTLATELSEVNLPIDNTPIRKSETAVTVNLDLKVLNRNSATVVEDFFAGNSYGDGGTDLNIDYKDLLVGMEFVKELTGSDTLKKMIVTNTERLRNSLTDYELIEVIEDTWTGLDDELRVGKITNIISIVPKTYKKTRHTTGLDMLFKCWREIIMARRVYIETKNVNVSRKIIKEVNDIYGVMVFLKSNKLLDINHHSFSGYLDKEEQKTLTNYKIIGHYIKVSPNFELIFTEVANAIKANLNNEFDGKLDVIDNLQNVTGAINTFQLSLRKSVIESIKHYSLIERLFILKTLFTK